MRRQTARGASPDVAINPDFFFRASVPTQSLILVEFRPRGGVAERGQCELYTIDEESRASTNPRDYIDPRGRPTYPLVASARARATERVALLALKLGVYTLA